MSRPTSKFFEGRNPPNLPLRSKDNLDWYAEQIDRVRNGFSFRGTTFTGDQWWFYNFNPMMVAEVDSRGVPTGEFRMDWPYWNQTDDWIFKQIDEAKKEGMDVMIMGCRGSGKTYIVLSIATQIFFLTEKSHGVISAATDPAASETWSKFRDSVAAVNNAHPTIALNLINENDKELRSGDNILVNGVWKTEWYSYMEKVIYDKKPGITKGRRLNFQQWEEVGEWGNAAKLKECYTASKGTWQVGKIKKARVFYTGTGGTILSDQAKELFMNPLAYNIYPVTEYKGRKVALFIPADLKYGGFYETGYVDREGARKAIMEERERAKLDPDPLVLNKLTQEYPLTIDEMFQKKGGNRFDQQIIARNIIWLEENPHKRPGKWCNLHWKKKDGKIVGVEIEEHPTGKIWILEEPVINKDHGVVEPRLYVGGYDGIDIGRDESTSGKSRGAISIKKRFLRGAGTSNIYVCHYFDRPRDVDELYENCFKIMVLYNALTNIEFSKVGIVGYLKRNKGLHYLMNRPRITLSNVRQESQSNLIGTVASDKNFEYAENFLVDYIKQHGEQLMCLPVLEDLRDFTMDDRGSHDITVSMMMAELADDELMEQPVGFPPPIVQAEEEYGYYTDEKGIKRWGKIPANVLKKMRDFNFQPQIMAPDMYDQHGNPIYLNRGGALNQINGKEF